MEEALIGTSDHGLYVKQTGVFQNIDDLGTLRGGMLCNAGYVHGDTSR
jgi:hypothetical protein